MVASHDSSVGLSSFLVGRDDLNNGERVVAMPRAPQASRNLDDGPTEDPHACAPLYRQPQEHRRSPHALSIRVRHRVLAGVGKPWAGTAALWNRSPHVEEAR